MPTDRPDPLLLTPGPLTTSAAVKAAMLRDWGSRDHEFLAINRRVRERLVALAGAQDTHVCVPVQGSGTFAVEATIGTLVPPDGKAAILVNGAYGERMAQICERIGRRFIRLSTPEDTPNDVAALGATMSDDPDITHVLAVQCETTSGILNPISAIAQVTADHGRRLVIDAMSSFGALALDAREIRFDAAVASANKCLEGVPGLGFAIARTSTLRQCGGNSPSLSLDLHDQWAAMERNAQWRFTPPTHVVAALDCALEALAEEGGVAARGARYRRNCELLVEGMRAMGFRTLLPAALQAPIIVSFHTPADPRFEFERFYDGLATRGFVIYPGKLTVADSFRIGCIGRVGETEIRAALDAVRDTLREMQVTACAPTTLTT